MAEDFESGNVPPVSPPKRKFFSGLFGRKGQSAPSPVNENVGQPPVVPQQPVVPPPERVKSPEMIKAEISAGLSMVCNLKDKMITKRAELAQLMYVDPEMITVEQREQNVQNEAKLKAEMQNLRDSLGEISSKTIKQMEEAQAVLGDFCRVIGNADHRAAILLSPLQKQRTVSVTSNDPLDADRFKGEPPAIYTKKEKFYEIYSLSNGDGLNKTEVMTDMVVENVRPDVAYLMKSSFDAQEWLIKQSELSAASAFAALLNGREIPENANEAGAQMFGWLKNRILGAYPNWSEQNDRVGRISWPLGMNMATPQSLASLDVTFVPDALEALNLSVNKAAIKREKVRPGTWESDNQYLYVGPNDPANSR